MSDVKECTLLHKKLIDNAESVEKTKFREAVSKFLNTNQINYGFEIAIDLQEIPKTNRVFISYYKFFDAFEKHLLEINKDARERRAIDDFMQSVKTFKNHMEYLEQYQPGE
jgi:hypothetical protein